MMAVQKYFTPRSNKAKPIPFPKPTEGVWIGEFSSWDDAARKVTDIKKSILDNFKKTRTTEFSFEQRDGRCVVFFRSHEEDVLKFVRDQCGHLSERAM